MEIGHGRGLWNPIGGTAKRKAGQAIKNGWFVIQDALDFYEWAKSGSTTITYSYISVEDYENSEKFSQAVCENIRIVLGTMMLHAVHSIKPNRVWLCNLACFKCNKCFSTSFQPATCCKSWNEFSLMKPTKTVQPKRDKKKITRRRQEGTREKP